jgi:hypothetical protein
MGHFLGLIPGPSPKEKGDCVKKALFKKWLPSLLEKGRG